LLLCCCVYAHVFFIFLSASRMLKFLRMCERDSLRGVVNHLGNPLNRRDNNYFPNQFFFSPQLTLSWIYDNSNAVMFAANGTFRRWFQGGDETKTLSLCTCLS
jgi:hypothetical protein